MTKAQERRSIAVGMLHELILPTPPNNSERDFANYATREFTASNIEKLSQLGRTDRWQIAIRNWANAVRDESLNFSWAYLQYSVYVNFAL